MPANSFARTPIYVLDAVRTPVGSPFKSLKNFSAVQLGAVVISSLLSRMKIDPDQIDEAVFGNTVMAGVGQNPARQSALLAGLAVETPAYTVNHVCGAGLQAIVLASQSIALGHSQAIIAGGMESATRTPQLFSKLLDAPFNEREPVDSLIFDGLWCAMSAKHMGELCENLARSEKISRASQDQYAFESHQKARAASQAKNFSSEIIPVLLDNGDAYDRDERLRSVSLENLKGLPPAFTEKGTITAGSASVPSDGAAAVLLSGESFLRENKISPLGKITAYASIAVDPSETFKATVPATEQCLKASGLKISDIDLFEIDEAFAAQAIFAREQLRIPAEKMNIYGGDIALGHPLGAAGARILVTLLHSLKNENKKRGLAVICLGGGGAVAMIVENLK